MNGKMIAALMIGLTLTACKGDTNLFPQEEDQLEIAKEDLAELESKVDQSGSTAKNGQLSAKAGLTGEAGGLSAESEASELFSAEASAGDQGDGLVREGNPMAAEGKRFYYEEISEAIKVRIEGKSYGKDCDVPYEELRYVSVTYYGFDGDPHSGELIVNKAIAEDIVAIFKELYEAKYPIERMVLVDEYDADDNASMAANNSSAFNYRKVDGTDRLSNHSYGLAIDINPLYNPYVRKRDGKKIVTPEEGAEYADRSLSNPYYIHEGDACYEAFIKRGFTWGGEWKNSKDYQHFEKKAE